MSQPTGTTIDNLTTCVRLPGFHPGGYVDQFIRKIPFQQIPSFGAHVQINRVTAISNGAFYAAAASLPRSPTETTLATFDFRRLGDIVQIDTADEVASSQGNDQLLLQIEMKRVALLRQLGAAIIEGNGVTPNLAGLKTLVAGGQTVGANNDNVNGGVPTLFDYHRLLAEVTASDGFVGAGPDAIVLHPRARRQLVALLEAAGSAAYEFRLDSALGVPILHLEGIPVYSSSGIAVNETKGASTNLTSAYALKTSGNSAVRVLHADGSSSSFGLIVEPQPAQAAVAERAALVRGYYAVLVPEDGSLARMDGIDISGYP